MDRRVCLYAVLGIGLLVCAPWLTSLEPFGNVERTYAYTVQPAEESLFDYEPSDVRAFEPLSPEARTGIERALADDGGTAVVSDESVLAPEFDFITDHQALGTGVYIVEYRDAEYELQTSETTPLFTNRSIGNSFVGLWFWLWTEVGGRLALVAAVVRGLRLVYRTRRAGG